MSMQYLQGQVSIRQLPEGEEIDKKYERISAIISSGAEDSFGTYMTEKTLQNFTDALNNDYIQVKDSHDRRQGFGVSESGEFTDGKVIGHFRLRRDWNLNDASLPTTNQIIEGIRERIITKVSVGFGDGRHICSICDSEWGRGGCYHWPKREYEIEGDDGVTRLIKCRIAIDDAKLIEVSIVDSGSNPDAVILERAMQRHAEGNLPSDIRQDFERNYGLRFDDVEKINVLDKNKERGIIMDAKEKDLQEQLQTVTKERDEARQKIEDLEPLADCGREARKYMAGQALDAYKVSRGEALQENEVERFSTRADKMSFADLQLETEHLRSIAPAKPDVEPGSKTRQPDNTDSPDKERKKETAPIVTNPPGWGVRYKG